jgi:hypothetical protein
MLGCGFSFSFAFSLQVPIFLLSTRLLHAHVSEGFRVARIVKPSPANLIDTARRNLISVTLELDFKPHVRIGT